MKKQFLALGVIAAAMVIFAAPCWAKGTDEAVGSVVAVRGEVKAVNSKGERLLAMKADVFPSDTIRTGKGGRIQLLFEDNTIISLGDSSVMEIAKYNWDARKQTGAMKTRVEEGTFRVLGGLITKNSPKDFSTETPAATIGIRGSMYAGSFRNNLLNVQFLGGHGIFVANRQGHVEIDRVGFGTRVMAGQAPELPAKMDIQESAGLVEGLREDGTGAGAGDGAGTAGGETAATGSSTQTGETMMTGDSTPTGETVTPLSPQNAELLDPGTSGFVDTSALAVAVDQSTNVVVTASNSTSTGTTAAAVGTTSTATASMSGWSQSFLKDISGVLVEAPRPGVTATSVDGYVGDGIGLQSFTMARYNPSATYTTWGSFNEMVTVPTVLGGFPGYRYLFWDDKGEFFTYLQEASSTDSNYFYESLAFAGVPATTLPTTGIEWYWGLAVGGSVDPVEPYYTPGSVADFEMSINWANRKVLGIGDSGDGDLIYYYGNVDSPSSVRFLSGDSWSDGSGIPWGATCTTGIVDFAQFYGSEHQGFGFTAHGLDYELASMTVNDSWQASGGMFREPSLSLASPTGTPTWSGFYIGAIDSLTSPQISYIWQNTSSTDLSLALDAAAGTVTGAMISPSMYPATLPLGGATTSTYIDNQRFIAEFLPGTYGTTMPVNVQSPGSFLVTASYPDQFSNYTSTPTYATWGYWSLVDGTSQVHYPSSFWVAGPLTPATEINNLVTTNFTGTYAGPAFGVVTDATNIMTPLTNGATNLTYNFGSGAINGTIGFAEQTLNVAATTAVNPTTASFTAVGAISGDSGSTIAGGFFGPAAATMAGTFNAQMSTNRYSGIFGGNR